VEVGDAERNVLDVLCLAVGESTISHTAGTESRHGPLTTCQAVLASVVGSSRVSLGGGFMFVILSRLMI
jgi:hypothetical protein